MSPDKKAKFEKMFKEEVNDKAKKVDPDNEQDWYSLTLGWAIAKGMSPNMAHDFATYIRYETPLG